MRAGRRDRAEGEFELLAKVRAAVERLGRGPGVVVGIGDDCAVVRPAAGLEVLTTDTMVEGVHFRTPWLTPLELGRRAFRAAVSDVAAMGAAPRHALLSLEIPAGAFDSSDALALVRGVAAEARRSGAALVGGNVSGGPRLSITVTVVGEAVARPLLRRDAKPGDLVFVTGSLGGAGAGLCALLAADASSRRPGAPTAATRAASAAWRRPPSRLAFAQAVAKAGLAHAMIDVSDGLLQDLGHVAAESRATVVVDAGAVPVHAAARRFEGTARRRGLGAAARDLALAGGEDYELAFTAPPRRRAAIDAISRRLRTPVSIVGFVARGEGRVVDLDGEPFAQAAGFDHLRRRGTKGMRGR